LRLDALEIKGEEEYNAELKSQRGAGGGNIDDDIFAANARRGNDFDNARGKGVD
jgi:hypothetical protein